MTLSPEIVDGLEDVNITEFTELQEQVFSTVREGKNALIKATTESDFTSFAVPSVELIQNRKEEKDGISVLVLTPNPEESQEIDELIRAIGYHAQISCASIDMDADPEEQEKTLGSDLQAIVGNPGPLADTIETMRYVFRDVDLVVIDAADKMVSLNLQSKIKNILRRVLGDYQTLIYMDEYNDDVKELAQNYVEKPVIIGFDEPDSAGMFSNPPEVDSSIRHGYIYVPDRMAISTLTSYIKENNVESGVIFTASKRGTDRLYRTLRKQNLKATSLHGKLSDEKRSQRFANFTNGDVQFLLVADISAAELGLTDIAQVINYDVPSDPDEYRYRTEMLSSNSNSELVSLVSKQDRSDINKLESTLSNAPKERPLPKKVKKQLKERKKKKKSDKKSRKNGRNKKKDNDMELPRPTFDKLSGGRKGQKQDDKKSGVIGMIKQLFS